jgi:hypothetical protein
MLTDAERELGESFIRQNGGKTYGWDVIANGRFLCKTTYRADAETIAEAYVRFLYQWIYNYISAEPGGIGDIDVIVYPRLDPNVDVPCRPIYEFLTGDI